MKTNISIIFFLIFGVVSLVSCEGEDVAYEKTYQFDNGVVSGSQPLVFKYNNTADTFQLYDVVLEITHLPGAAMQFPFALSYTSPYGESVQFPVFAIPAYDNALKPYGDVQSDSSIVLRKTILAGNSMRKGMNVFSIVPGNYNDTLTGIKALTLKIDRVN